MKDLRIQYEQAKKKAIELMELGDVSAYITMLSKANQYKKLMNIISYN